MFEQFLISLEKAFELDTLEGIYSQRHLANFLLFFIATMFFYKFTSFFTKDLKLQLLFTLMLIVSPRIFAHSFYNSKDIPLLSMFIIASYYNFIFIQDKSFLSGVFAAISSAVLINTRVIGVMAFGFTSFLYLLVTFIEGKLSKRTLKSYVFIYILNCH